MKNKHFNLTSGIVLILIPLVFSFTGCKDDYETYYEGYGLVSKSGDEKFTVKLDDGYLLYPREYYFNPEKLNDSTRLRIRFNILEEQDTNLYARIVYADTILTKSILPYDETILDSVGNAPVKIVNSWFAHGFLNFEFMFAAHLNPSTGKIYYNAPPKTTASSSNSGTMISEIPGINSISVQFLSPYRSSPKAMKNR